LALYKLRFLPLLPLEKCFRPILWCGQSPLDSLLNLILYDKPEIKTKERAIGAAAM
jgi:hypothetical protein